METVLDAKKASAAGVHVRRDGDLARIELDVPGAKMNVLAAALLSELEATLEALAADAGVRAVVLTSGKPDGFVAGADISAIETLPDRDAARAAAVFGQRVFDRIENLGKPVVAAVHGVCLGGGCEMVLACHARILSDDPSTRIGLPEVKLGLVPGFGGTQRLPRVVGLQAALDLILTGRTLDARRALRTGLADEVVYPALLVDAASAWARRLVSQGRWSVARPSRRSLWTVPGFLDRTTAGHAIVFAAAAKKVRRETHGHYPAPLAAIAAVRAGVTSGGKAYAREAEVLADCAMTDVSRNLVRLFRLGEANKKLGHDLPQPEGRVRQIAVVGAGVMGGGIAHQASRNDVRVRMKDLGTEPLLAAFRTARDLFRGEMRRGRLDQRGLENKMAQISASLDYTGFGLAEVVIEAVVENLDVKRTVLRELEAAVGDGCVLATNTSSLSIAAMAEALRRPGRLVGMHFFNPVHRMPLVEIVRGPASEPQAVAVVLGLARQMGKTPVLVGDGPGFLVNRVLAPYLNEAGWLFEAGCDPVAVDAAFKRFGMPMGPFELLDEIGTDVAHKVGDVLHAGLGARMEPSPLAASLHAAGRLGRKTRRGMYVHAKSSKRRPEPDRAFWNTLRPDAKRAAVSDGELCDRVFGLMINEAVRCLDEGIVGSAAELDLALVYGIGFPPFRGGLLQYADARGLDALVTRMRALESQVGARFAPADRLIRMTASGERFFLDPRTAARG